MKARLLCQDPEHQIDQLVDVVSLEPLKTKRTVSIYDSKHSEVDDIIHGAFMDTIYEVVFESFSLKPAGHYIFAEVADHFEKHGIRELYEYCATYPYKITLSCVDEAFPSQTVFVDLCEVLVSIFKSEESSIQLSFDVGGIIISSMEEFIKTSKWHCDMVNPKGQKLSKNEIQIPLMWFGIDGDPPEKGWILNPHHFDDYDDWRKFWLRAYDGGEECRVEDWDWVLSTTLALEVGESLPFVDISTCPVIVTDEMTLEEVEERIVEYYNSNNKK